MSDDENEAIARLQEKLLALAKQIMDEGASWNVAVMALHGALSDAIQKYPQEPLVVFEALLEVDTYRLDEWRKMKASEPERREKSFFDELEKREHGYGKA